jgi:hypothetical protein
MISFLGLLLHVSALPFRSRASLEAEIVFLRHQLNVLKRQAPARPRLSAADRSLFVRLYRWIPSLLNAAVIVRPDTIVRWHRMGFRLYWRWQSRFSLRERSNRLNAVRQACPAISAVTSETHQFSLLAALVGQSIQGKIKSVSGPTGPPGTSAFPPLLEQERT